MNREIKFRAIIPEQYSVILFGLTDFIRPLFSIRELLIHWLAQGNIPDRYTGLKDKNGVDIYESDIVRLMGKRNYIVKWDANHFLCPLPDENILGIGTPTSRVETEDGEIIGNIHENGELIEKN